ncbi:O-antigen translocase [Mucilaginibacter xinganensis]|uniref:O-antigen translocase, WzxE n=1 Tax=Mucilaginibacter xinganensis TaxID=1234841 RepID=A0A223NUW1_9SPHI|nr:O-antigen translocase [Mucilaginibacter xinganensis]ASU33647.1 O-antigen translocase, WzxE [Mucilaginibacter xinganensis]
MKLVKTTFFSAIITFIRISSGFVAGKVVSLFTGPAGVALIGQFTNFITIILTFANGAINTGVVKYTAEYSDDNQQLKALFSTSLKISIYCSGIVGAILLLSSSYLSTWMFNTSLYNNPIRVLGVTIILYSLNTLLISILNGKQQIKTYTIVNTVGSIVGLLLTVVLVYFYKVEGALYALVLAQSIVFVVTFILIIKSDWFSISYFNGAYDSKLGRKLFNYSLMTVVTALTGPVSQIILRKLLITNLGINSAGYWQGMMRISDGYLLLITTSLSTYYLPKLSSLNTEKELRKEIFHGYKIILPAVFFGCITIYFLRHFIIRILYTGEFEGMQSLFAFQLLGDFFKMAAWLLGYMIIAKAMTRTYIITEILFSFSYVFLSYFCISIFKLQGITIAFAINYFIYLIVMVIIFRKLLFK